MRVWDIYKRGQKDALRHNKRLKEAVKRSLTDAIQESEITIDREGKKYVRVKLKELDLYRFIHASQSDEEGIGKGEGNVGDKAQVPKPGAGSGAGNLPGNEEQEIFVPIEEYIDILLEDLRLPNIKPKSRKIVTVYDEDIEGLRRVGPETTLDRRASLLANLKRNAIRGNPQIGNWANEDLRFFDYEVKPTYISPLVIYLVLDRSGSMTYDKRAVAKTFFFLTTEILKRLYKSRAILRFVMYDAEANFVDEKEFFETYSTGGTKVSTALKLISDDFRNNYQGSNGYVFIASDGDNWEMDNYDAERFLKELLSMMNYVFYLEVRVDPTDIHYGRPLSFAWESYDKRSDVPFNQFVIMSKGEIISSIKKFLRHEE